MKSVEFNRLLSRFKVVLSSISLTVLIIPRPFVALFYVHLMFEQQNRLMIRAMKVAHHC
jgi:hypothetical protein